MGLEALVIEKENDIAIVMAEGVVLTDVHSALDLIGTVAWEAGSNKLIIFKENVAEDFFNLSNGKLGEVLQKFVMYQIRLAIVGDFSSYSSKPLKDFIFESNKGKHIFFTDNKQSAQKMLSND